MVFKKVVTDLTRFDAGDSGLVASEANLDVRELSGLLKQSSRRDVSVDEMNAAILRQHARKP